MSALQGAQSSGGRVRVQGAAEVRGAGRTHGRLEGLGSRRTWGGIAGLGKASALDVLRVALGVAVRIPRRWLALLVIPSLSRGDLPRRNVDAELLQQISQLVSPAERVLRANQLIADYQAAVTEISRLRREALEELIALGRTQTDIAAELGMTRARVGQLLSSGPRPERLFLGAGAITVALGGKREADSRGPGRVLAQEDVKAYDHLRELANGFGLGITYETVEPPGFLNLNRDNLIVICGPRLSPLLAQVLESDSSVGFENDDRGWYLVDRVAHKTYRSPMDTGQHRDYAYLGRLPRLDGRGNFLYIAGIHAMGAPCVIHYLEDHLTELYSEVKTRRFSTIISGDFDAETLEVSSSSRLTPIYRPESG